MASGVMGASAYVSLRPTPIEGPGTCGMQKPLRVSAFLGGGVAVTSTQTLACPIVPRTDRFLAEVVQPAAMAVLGAQVIEMRAGSYSCRAMNNGSGTTRRSEHAFGNALDIFAFRLSDGREVTVKSGWKGSPEEQAFLREVFVGACAHYSTVLGPGADMFHYDHFHVDLARHAGGRSVCRPVLKFTPRRDLPPRDPAGSHAALPAPPAAALAGVRPPPPRPAGREPFAPGLAGQTIAAAPPPPAMATPRAAPASPPLSHQRDLAGPNLAGPNLAGPIRLPGSPGREEVVVGDVEGELVDPDNDPFAAEPPQRLAQPQPQPGPPLPPVQPQPQPLPPQPLLPPARLGWSVGPQPVPQASQRESQRPWPPRF